MRATAGRSAASQTWLPALSSPGWLRRRPEAKALSSSQRASRSSLRMKCRPHPGSSSVKPPTSLWTLVQPLKPLLSAAMSADWRPSQASKLVSWSPCQNMGACCGCAKGPLRTKKLHSAHVSLARRAAAAASPGKALWTSLAALVGTRASRGRYSPKSCIHACTRGSPSQASITLHRTSSEYQANASGLKRSTVANGGKPLPECCMTTSPPRVLRRKPLLSASRKTSAGLPALLTFVRNGLTYVSTLRPSLRRPSNQLSGQRSSSSAQFHQTLGPLGVLTMPDQSWTQTPASGTPAARSAWTLAETLVCPPSAPTTRP
mmetsp:Transcript_11829/g.37080  ORF Transcript_11829/g.37080 Transcript_11829/m.37080 type:complete len:318 (+) Transcript_11829:518-1471(+)